MYKLEIYIPESHVEVLLKELSALGACKVGNYDHVASLSPVKGCWRSLENANPYHGNIGELTYANELKVETVCPEHLMMKAKKIIKEVHPYEEPMFHFFKRVE